MHGRVGEFSPDGHLFAYATIGAQGLVSTVELPSGPVRALTTPEQQAWGPSWSPDGKSLAYFAKCVASCQGSEALWIWSRDTGTSRQLSTVTISHALPWFRPVWGADGKAILVALNRVVSEAANSVSQMSRNSGDRSAFDNARSPVTPSVFKANRPDGSTRRVPGSLSLADRVAKVEVATGVVTTVFAGAGIEGFYLSRTQEHLAVLQRLPMVDENVAAVAQRLSIIDMRDLSVRVLEHTLSIADGELSWSPNGRFLAWVADYTPEVGPAYIVDISINVLRATRIVANVEFASGLYQGRKPVWSVDASTLYLVTAGEIWQVSVATGKARQITQGPHPEVLELLETASGNTVLSSGRPNTVVAVVRDAQTYDENLAGVNLATGAVRLSKEVGFKVSNVIETRVSPSASKDGLKVAYLAERSDQPIAIWLVDNQFEHPHRLVPLDRSFESGIYGTARLLRWKAVDGSARAGALLLPPGESGGHKYPLIVDVYGGELFSRYVNTFGCGAELGMNLQVFATRGYAVLRPDTPLRLGSPVQDLVDTVIPGLDAAINTGLIDPEKIGVMGSSYGGYGTLALITHSDRFRAAASQATQADLLSSVYGNSGLRGSNPGWAEGAGQGRMGGTPWQFRERYIDNSPSWFLDRVHTPLLLLHGSVDPVVPEWESTLIFNSLQRLGREVEYVRYPGEGHGFVSEAVRIDAESRIVAWFDEHLKHQGE